MKKEEIKANVVAPTLFVGLGGIGSKIVKRVAELSYNDDIDAVRFVVLDTDVNELDRVEKGATITAIQTSSPRTVRDYLDDDSHAEKDWFPVNNILDDKTVSEGAGQVRAISRLALNATIKNGNINRLYKAIDELFLKNGSDKNQAIKVVIASTAAGGTGSGIAMIIGMLIRHYLKKNYPESAAIIRGCILLPGVLDTVIPNESERESLRRNGYASMREINAFMMKGSGFFSSERRLRRYSDLHITLPTTGGELQRLDGLPFDFCFLFDRTDGIQKSMKGLEQYIEYASQSLYEQNIGWMRFSASSKEDNVIKEFTDPKKLGRCRFGAAGAAKIKYPYEDICNYIALEWTGRLLFGSDDNHLSDEKRDELINDSWLRYDILFENELKKYEKDINSSGKEPKRSEVYIDAVENEEGNRFTDELFEKYLKPKISNDTGMNLDNKMLLKTTADELVDTYLRNLCEAGKERVYIEFDSDEKLKKAKDASGGLSYVARFKAIQSFEDLTDDVEFESIVYKFVKGVFESDSVLSKQGLEEYMFQKYISNNGQALHPNAVRYLLYKLYDKISAAKKDYSVDTGYEEALKEIKEGDNTQYQIKSIFGNEGTLLEMCQGCDKKGKFADFIDSVSKETPEEACRDLLKTYCSKVEGNISRTINRIICELGEIYIGRLTESYEKFYKSFKDKAVSLTKEKENLIKKIEFRKGDCVWNLFNEPGCLEALAGRMKERLGTSGKEPEMFEKVHMTLKKNGDIEERNKYDTYSRENTYDVFEEVMIGYYRKLVETQLKDELDVDVLHAIKLEYQTKCDMKMVSASTDDEKERISTRSKNNADINAYIQKTLNRGKNLATPGICKKSFDESRDVNAVAYSKFVKDGAGLRVSDFFDAKDATDTVSKYEVRFFRSIYVLTPLDVFQFSAPKDDKKNKKPTEVLFDGTNKRGAGESFIKYQTYMEDIGPDSRLNSVITPHIDTRWNSISVMPEIDLEYQDKLMRHIHKAMFYGFMFGIITRYCPSSYDPEKYVYRYHDDKGGFNDFIVSNKTKCDKLYEVLDALYNDRAAVRSIHSQVVRMHLDDERNSLDYKDSQFKCAVDKFTRDSFINIQSSKEGEITYKDKVSVFEMPVLYYNSLPSRLRDSAELEIMVEAIIEAIEVHVSSFSDKKDAAPHLGKIIASHYNLLCKNYKAMPKVFGRGEDINSNDIILTIRKKVEAKLIELDVTMPKLGDVVD